jgi:pyruvate kinase
MAIATFHSNRGEKSALILVKANAFVFSATPVYVPRTALAEDIKKGDTFTLPDGYTLVDIVDIETGEVRTTKTGVALKQLQY